MKICFVGRGRLRDFKESYQYNGEELIIFGFEGMGEVSYEKELNGASNFFEEAALLSKNTKATVVCGCITNMRGHKRKSALVAEEGKLVGVSDMLNVIDGEVGAGATLRIYDTKIGRMGIAVEEDILFPETVKSLALCGSDFIVCPFTRVRDTLTQTLLRAYGYLYGIPILFCGVGYSMIADMGGSICFASPQSPIIENVKIEKEYHLVETRRRGKK